MGNLAVWKVLEEMVIELRKKPVGIPLEILNDLKSAKILLEITDSNTTQEETAIKIERYLENIEIYIFSKIQEKFKPKTVEEWLKRVSEARNKEVKLTEETKFISGIPRNQKWIRVKPISELPLRLLKKIAKENGLLMCANVDGKFIIYGKAENIRSYVKKITEITSEKMKTTNK
ncbi:DUF2096 domain-containing protein [Candidatus Bathyarchaeota archaeon]|nr:DUF2096 domain-containing protein [Candidatus Bathyarchaeota archaeon]